MRWVPAILAVAFCAAVCFLFRLTESRSQNKLKTNQNVVSLTASPKSQDLGTLIRRGKRNYEVTVRNCTTRALRIEKIEVTCNCMTVEPQQVVLAPGEAVQLTVRVDLNDEPDFIGKLLLGIRGIAYTGEVFESTATVSVIN